MDKSEYIEKMKHLLEDAITYKPLNMDPTNKQKNKLVNILRRIKTGSGMEDTTYRMMYPTGGSSPKLYRQPKIHKNKTPPEVHCLKQRLCDVWANQRAPKNSQTPDW